MYIRIQFLLYSPSLYYSSPDPFYTFLVASSCDLHFYLAAPTNEHGGVLGNLFWGEIDIFFFLKNQPPLKIIQYYNQTTRTCVRVIGRGTVRLRAERIDNIERHNTGFARIFLSKQSSLSCKKSTRTPMLKFIAKTLLLFLVVVGYKVNHNIIQSYADNE